MGSRGSASSGLEIKLLQTLFALRLAPGCFDDTERLISGCILRENELERSCMFLLQEAENSYNPIGTAGSYLLCI